MSILWNFDKYAKIEMLPFDPLCINDDNLIPISDVELLLKAGTPLSLAGAESEHLVMDGEEKPSLFTPGTVHPIEDEAFPTCFAAEDYHFILTNAQQPKLVECVTKGYIEKAKVLEALDTDGAGALDELEIEAADPTADWAEGLAALGLYLVDDLGALPAGGSGGGALLIGPAPIPGYVDCTWQDISDALSAGKTVMLGRDADILYLSSLEVAPYRVRFFNGSSSLALVADANNPNTPMRFEEA
jgi:hypothetical protein